MLLSQQLPTGIGYSIELPPGWIVILDTTSGVLRAFLSGTVSHREAGTSVESGDADLSLSAISPGTTLETYAEARMRQHVRQGEPERFADVIGGHPAIGYTWTDGVLDIATWFLEPLPSAAVRIDHSIPSFLDRARLGRDARGEGSALLATLRWVT
ncbi:MAG: hypothetical protein JST00_20115 [Deltaproteobacteria bacterium]|nr:hypothetical protein [Deltaproteobacteria bacterium]